MIFTKQPLPINLNKNSRTLYELSTEDKVWLNHAQRFFIIECENYPTNLGNRKIYIEARKGFDGTKWIVIMDGFTLGRDNKFHYENRPSRRTEDYISKTRYSTKELALSSLINHIDELKGNQGILTID